MNRVVTQSLPVQALRSWTCLAALLTVCPLACADDVPTGPETTLAAVGPTRAAEQWLEWGSRYRLTSREPGRVEITLQRYERPWQGMAPPGAASGRVALGVYVNTGGPAQFGWQSRSYGTEHLPPWLQDAPQRPEGMALRAADPLADLRLGALARFSFGGQTSLALRPRKGGLRLMLQSQW